MALSGYDGLASYDITASGELDIRPELHAILLADTAFMGRIGMGSDVAKTVHYWLQDELNASTVTLAILTDSATSVVAVSVPAGLQVGAILMDTAIGKSESIQVTAISGTTLTITRGFGASAPAGEAHGAAAVWRIVSVPKPEGDSTVTDESRDRTRLSNQTQIFKKEVAVSDTQIAENPIGVGNEFAYSLKNRMLELKKQMNMAALLGVRSAAGADSVYRTMDGLRNFVRTANSGSQLTTSSEALSETVMNLLYSKVWDAGGDADAFIAHANQIKKFSTLYVDKIRLAPSDKVRGVFVNKFLTNLGFELDLLIERWALPGDGLIMKSANVKLCAHQGRGLKVVPLAKTGDAERAMMVGEYTLEVFNPEACFALHTGLTA